MRNEDWNSLRIVYDHCVADGQEYKESEEYLKAAECYYDAKRMADILHIDGEFLHSMITSCYRKAGDPQKAIMYFDELKAVYHPAFLFNHALLTSVAGAYCDVGEWELAEQTLYKAIDANKGEKNGRMEFLEDRINSHYNKEFSG